jgi:hypothetical protein
LVGSELYLEPLQMPLHPRSYLANCLKKKKKKEKEKEKKSYLRLALYPSVMISKYV